MSTSNTPWRLSELIAGLGSLGGAPLAHDPMITGISTDSREIEPGWLFVAVPGVRGDGRAYVSGALARGAAAVVHEPGGDMPAHLPVPSLAVPQLRSCVGRLADQFFGQPSQALQVIGVTGTNGKTTCTQLLAQALDEPGRRCGVIGTLGAGFPGELEPGTHTTPDAVSVHRLLARMRDSGATRVCMEVSSHALEQGRVDGVAFDIAVFTNLTRDHLDYHGTLEAYGSAKARLFEIAGLQAAVINADDPFGRDLMERTRRRCRVLSYGVDQGDVRATELVPLPEGLRLRLTTPDGDAEIDSPLLGRFNAANLLAALACLEVGGWSVAEAARRLARARPVSGRMERFTGSAAQPLVVVDYAHTPDALDKALAALREHVRGRLWCVFGCGGDRDRGKRPLMGALAERLADVVVLTDDNPRHEDPELIIREIAAGMRGTPTVVRDRGQAIRLAVREAHADDIVLVAGKGHEDYQQVGNSRLPFSDRDTVLQALKEAA